MAQGFNSVDLGGGRTIYLPNIGESNTNTDSLIASFGLRYGVSDRLETRVLRLTVSIAMTVIKMVRIYQSQAIQA